jgi:hypothetical protein
MSVLFFPLRSVPTDEADDVRALLIANEIEFYETSAGNWGVSMPAIWLYQQADLEKIQPHFAEYQQKRTLEQRQLYLQSKQQAGAFNLKKSLTSLPMALWVFLYSMYQLNGCLN